MIFISHEILTRGINHSRPKVVLGASIINNRLILIHAKNACATVSQFFYIIKKL